MAENNPHLLTAQGGVELVHLLNELTRIRPLEPDDDDVRFSYHADGLWRVTYGSVLRNRCAPVAPKPLAEDLLLRGVLDPHDWMERLPYSTLVEALRAAVNEYRSHPTHDA